MRKLITWDFKESGMEQLSDALTDFGLYLSGEIDTGDDSIAVVLSDRPMTDEEVMAYYHEALS